MLYANISTMKNRVKTLNMADVPARTVYEPNSESSIADDFGYCDLAFHAEIRHKTES